MVYVSSGGTVLNRRSPWDPNTWVHWFWGIINFIVLFFQTLFNPNLSSKGDNYVTDYRQGRGGGPPRPPGRRMGGFRTMSDLPCPPSGG